MKSLQLREPARPFSLVRHERAIAGHGCVSFALVFELGGEAPKTVARDVLSLDFDDERFAIVAPVGFEYGSCARLELAARA